MTQTVTIGGSIDSDMDDPLAAFRCKFCSVLAEVDVVFMCTSEHFVCLQCSTRNRYFCTCKKVLIKQKTNPLIDKLKATKLKLERASDSSAIMDIPTGSKCIGDYLGMWSCDWTGEYSDFEDHLKTAHQIIGDHFTYFQNASVPFDSNIVEPNRTITMISAFSKKFIFYYHPCKEKQIVFFGIFLIGPDEMAKQYLYNFEVTAPSEKHRKVKFIDYCYGVGDGLRKLEEDEKCVVMTYKTVENHSADNRLHFRFVIKSIEEEEKLMQKIAALNKTTSSDRIKK